MPKQRLKVGQTSLSLFGRQAWPDIQKSLPVAVATEQKESERSEEFALTWHRNECDGTFLLTQLVFP